MLEWSLDVLREVCDRVVVAVPPDRVEAPDFVAGGEHRSESVRNALLAAPQATVAVVHDAARPLVSAELVRRCIDGLEGYDGAIAATPVTDTIKEVDGERVVRTPDRSALWAVQTPQVFRQEVITRALEEALKQNIVITDDTAACEFIGQPVKLVESATPNPKATSPADLPYLELLLKPLGSR